MPLDATEKNLEDQIEHYLIQPALGGYRKGRQEEYSKELCLIPGDVLAFLETTQPRELQRLREHYGTQAEEKLLLRLAKEIEARGTLDVLRKGFRDHGCRFDIYHPKPSSSLNPDVVRLYQANRFAVIRQLHYSKKNNNSLDMALFLNGLPLFTTELKNLFTGQNINHAIHQYCKDRDPREPLFAFGRCLAHFAVDPDQAAMTTHLQESKTRFLPFNKGYNNGAGNPPALDGFRTSYLWEEVWSKDSVLNLIQHFIQKVEDEDENGKRTGKYKIIFPRYHQLRCVRDLIEDARQKGPGQWYLVQHSAGSGKSNSIAWLAHQLSVLHDEQDKRVYDSIIVITDRRVLDKQLQNTVSSFQQTLGVVENIDKTSKQLKQALEQGKTIIVTTLQKFPVIAQEVSELAGRRFALIIDEAHSSQSGESTKSIKKVLQANSLEIAEQEDSQDQAQDMEDIIVEEARSRGRLANASYFAFTATPKSKTMELFGRRDANGHYRPFSLYSMRQAIEEGFILDVLQNYTTYKAYWNLLKKIEDDPHYDRKKADYLLRKFVDLHEHTINKKVEIMVDHFRENVQHKIHGKAKAMIVTRSRLHAVRYKLAIDSYLKEKQYPFKVLVAFSGSVEDGGKDYTEAGMNGFSDTKTAAEFKRDDYKFLIVANKFQTGFDQPLLHTMYVDKKLGGVSTVQTLSRLNRKADGKEDTCVIDFANEADVIQKDFEVYYDRTVLTQGTDPNLLYTKQNNLEQFNVYSQQDLNDLAAEYFKSDGLQQQLYNILAPVVSRFNELEEEEQIGFRTQLGDYLRLYAFLSQLVSFTDADLERLYVFGKLLLKIIRLEMPVLPLAVQEQIDIKSYRLQETHQGQVGLTSGEGELQPFGEGVAVIPVEEKEPLSRIITDLNKRFGTDFTAEDMTSILELEARLVEDDVLQTSVRINPRDNARLTFDNVVDKRLQNMVDTHFKFYKQVNDNAEFGKVFKDWLFERFLKKAVEDTLGDG